MLSFPLQLLKHSHETGKVETQALNIYIFREIFSQLYADAVIGLKLRHDSDE